MPVHSFDYDTDYPGPAFPVVELGIKGGNGQTNEVIVGRDVLNQLVVTLNGLAGETTVSDS